MKEHEFVHFLFELEKRRTIQPKCPPSGCRCECCARSMEKMQPDIKLNANLVEMQRMYSLSSSHDKGQCGLIRFIDFLKSEPFSLPNFPVLDTVTFANGRPQTLLYYDEKLRVDNEVTLHQLKSFLLARKLANDIEYLK